MVLYIDQSSSDIVDGVVALAMWRMSSDVMAVRCEGTMTLGNLHSFTADAMRKVFVP